MPGLSRAQILKVVHGYIGVSGGYLGTFNYASHRAFYPVFCDLEDVNPDDIPGTTRERFEAILASLSPNEQARVLRGVVAKFVVGGEEAPDSRTDQMRDELLAWASSLEGVQLPVTFGTARESVMRALNDADVLLRRSGEVSAVDRIHTALHGYLLTACDEANIVYPDEPSMAKLLKLLRSEHPLRNRASVAHPNSVLLDEPEARLVINAARTILASVDEKLSDTPAPSKQPMPAPSWPEEEPFSRLPHDARPYGS